MFCVECGSEDEIFGSLCRNCLLSKELIMPPAYIALEMCHDCGRFFESGRWKDVYHIELASSILDDRTKTHAQVESLSWDIPDFLPEKGEHREICQAVAMIGGKEFEQDFEVGIRIRVQMCPSCSRKSSDYFEAVIQLRKDNVSTKDAEIELAIENQLILNYTDTLAGNEDNAFLSKWGTVQGGIDYYIGSIVLAKNIAAKMRDNYGASLKESNTVVGMRDGQDLFRWTILVRMPLNGVGDVVAYDRKLYVV
ncbi:MAG: 60S ribosomal export protein NMD3, partial [Thermoplasmata archaeon]|nr:60S ribosomal export protein NMD3 [Thermoplasmata archaeon]